MKKYILEISFSIILILTLIYNVIFDKSDKLFRILLIFITIAIFRFILSKSSFKNSKLIPYITESFIFFSMYLGNVLNVYRYISFYDKILHFISGIAVYLLAYYIYIYFFGDDKKIKKPFLSMLFCINTVLASAALWEIWEFSTDVLLGFNSQNGSLTDTMLDIIMAFSASLIFAFLIYLAAKIKNVNILHKIIKEIKNI